MRHAFGIYQTPNKEFVIFKRENIRRTYYQLLKDAERLACGLIHLGVEKGDRVGIWGPNTYEWVTAQFATALGGMVLVSGIAGAPCPITLCRRLVNEMHMRDMQVCYGTTETSPVSFMSIREDPPEQRIKSVGHIMDHLEAAVVDKHGKILPRGEKGEVIVRGYSVMRCYWNNEEQTKKEITADRWYHTGDIAVMHDNGTISIVGRSKDMIVRGGENIYPTEVEQFLFKHPKIEDAHVSLFFEFG
ncbi:AMP-binding enzyme, partial [Trichostrongylus colubriformis]